MPLITYIVITALIGLGVWAARRFIPMDPPFKTGILVVALAVWLLWTLGVFGLLPDVGAIRIGR